MKNQTLKEKAYEYIKDKIINCEFAPGDFLDEKQLIENIGASRTPIREALNKIEQENLIQIVSKKGIVVNQITFKDVSEIYQVRELIEPQGLLLYGKSLSKDILIEFKQTMQLQTNDSRAVDQTDDEFHRFLLSGYNNTYIEHLMEDIRGKNQRIRILSGKQNCSLPDTKQEHFQIIDALLAEDFLLAMECLKAHIINSKKRTMELF